MNQQLTHGRGQGHGQGRGQGRGHAAAAAGPSSHPLPAPTTPEHPAAPPLPQYSAWLIERNEGHEAATLLFTPQQN